MVGFSDERPQAYGNRVHRVSLDDFVETAKALSSELRIAILKALFRKPMNVAEIAAMFDIPASTAAVNVKKLEDCGLIKSEWVPGTRGTQKVCVATHHHLVIDLLDTMPESDDYVLVHMPVGHFFDAHVAPTCGLVSETSIIGEVDDPRAFFEPERIHAELLWFRRGYVEYRFPNRTPRGVLVRNLALTMEICSEAPLCNDDWPSDITLWVNGVEVGTWTSPGDFGGQRGVLTPSWWDLNNTQYGVLKTWRIDGHGAYLDGTRLSGINLMDVLGPEWLPSITVRIGVKADAVNDGGLNLFGRRFGNYESDIVLRIDYEPR